MKILLVEDDDRISSFLENGLVAEGHSVDRGATGKEGEYLAVNREYDVVLLDLMLPDMSGRDVLRGVRRHRPDLPVIVVSALGEIEDKVELLDEGADDYLTKPFAFAELSARIRATVRHGQENARILKVGDLSLDVRTRMAWRDDVSADLPSREFRLLEYLMRHAGQVLTRQQLLDAVWGFDFETGSNVVDVYVGYIRRKLDRPGVSSVIETVRGAGYRVPAV